MTPPLTSSRRRLELMSPAGYWPQLNAAIEAGADAVYFGLKHFSARAKVGFELVELPEVMRTLHQRGVKGFVTFNTLVFDRELEIAERTICDIITAGADALIVQDLGVARLVHELAPEFPIHGSTQMSVTSAEGAELAKDFGCSRIVLGRELSLQEIRQIRENTDLELEVFVHGALCVSYSGQCFSSEAWGGRSANRGQCAQACRLSYDLIVDGRRRELGAARYLLSPGDLCGLEQIPELVSIGVSCAKIEGRYKDADYVALVTQHYRRAIDAAHAGKPFENPPQSRQDLEQVYSRGLGPYFLAGTNHQQVVGGRAPRHRGLFVGQVRQVNKHSVVIDTKLQLQRGDGLVFDAADRRSPEITEQGGFVYDVQLICGNLAELFFGRGEVDFGDISIGDLVWRTHDPRLRQALKPLTHAIEPVFTRPVHFRVVAIVAGVLTLTATDELGFSVEFADDVPLSPAMNHPTQTDQVVEQLERLGGTPFHLGEVHFDTDGKAFVPKSAINRLRRSCVAKLLEHRAKVNPVTIHSRKLRKCESDVGASLRSAHGLDDRKASNSQIHILVRNSEQLRAAIESGPDSVTLDYLELYGLRAAVDELRRCRIRPRVASPRILKPVEQRVINFLLSLDCPIVVRSGGLLHELAKLGSANRPPMIGDFSLNAVNRFSVQALLDLGLERITPGFDLNAQQIVELTNFISPENLEIVLFHHLPIFHTEHCVFCRFLSSGTDNTNCGHPCEKHCISLRDGQGRVHPLMADVGCRNTVFNAEIQSAAPHLKQLQSVGLRHFRFEFVHQSGSQLKQAIESFRDYLAGNCDTAELDSQFSRCGATTTLGSYFVPKQPAELVQIQQRLGVLANTSRNSD